MTDESIPPPPALATPTPAPQYAAPAYPQGEAGYYQAPSAPTNVLAIVSMIASILGVIAMPILASIAGVVMGHIATNQIAQTGDKGAGMARAGLIVGYVGLVLWGLIIVGYILIFFLVFAATTTSSY